jgi:magnesium chelatase family protein
MREETAANRTLLKKRVEGHSPYMALFRTRSAAVYGIDAHLIDVEVDMFPSGSPRDFAMVGMPDLAVRESRQRIKSALMNSGFTYPRKGATINLAPANIRKEGAGFDLPIAMGILGAMGAVACLDNHLFMGELSLDGAIRPVRGALSVAVCARDRSIHNLIVPMENAAEAAVVREVNVYGVRHLAEVVALIARPDEFQPAQAQAAAPAPDSASLPDFRDVRTDHRPPRSRSRRRRRAQRSDDRSPWVRQDHAGEAHGRDSAAPHISGSHRNHQDPQHRRIAA